MSVKRRGGEKDANYFYRFSYNKKSYCKGGFRTKDLAEKAEHRRYDDLLKRESDPGASDTAQARILIEDACPIFLEKHGPSLKGGISKSSRSSYYNLTLTMKRICLLWGGRYFDSISDLDVRDYLSPFKTVGTRMRHLGHISKFFKSFIEWNDDRTILKDKVVVPLYNPGVRWRGKMKSSQKKELPRTRVLSLTEWSTFKVHLSPRARAVCEIALRRLLRKADIKQISYLNVRNEMLEGTQAKTGAKFTVPVLANQPSSYDLTNLRDEFKAAQVAAGLDYPPEHPLHFTMRDLRRTGATWVYNKTGNLRHVQRLLGHAKLSTTERYLNVSDENLRDTAMAIDSIVDSEVVSTVLSLQPGCNGILESKIVDTQNVLI